MSCRPIIPVDKNHLAPGQGETDWTRLKPIGVRQKLFGTISSSQTRTIWHCAEELDRKC